MNENKHIKICKNIEKGIIYTLISISVFIINLPIISMIGTSLKSNVEVLSTVGLFPEKIFFGNFISVLNGARFDRYLFNSLFYSLTVTALCIIVASLAGYAMSRYPNKIFKVFGALLLVILMFPLVLILVPLFRVFQSFSLIDKRGSIIISYLAYQLPFCIWLVKGFFDSIPYELEQAAFIDGCTQFQALYKVIFPLSLPGIATVGVFSFLRCWNEYMMTSILIKSSSINTISVGLRSFQQQFQVDWGSVSAASLLATIPSIIFILSAQKYLISGMTAGSIKG